MNRRTFLAGAGILFAGLMLPCTVSAAGKPLVAYFSRTGEQFGVGVISKGNTAITAEIIAQKTGADLCEISVVTTAIPVTISRFAMSPRLN